uniref:Homeobox domain-containing protein n=1 Tax=Hucho hucho TaxID=62062 RepID=A0A4W5KGT0_9TELE
MADLPPCSSSSMEEWQEKRGLQTMNLRSVFTLEQQRVLDSYYDNGMTNQSKSCFQLILQCAQETKLDFSVVRTWVGNKRRKLASRADLNVGVSHSLSLSNHSMVGGAPSNHGVAGVALSNHTLAGGALVAGAMLTAEMAAARNIQRGSSHLLPSSSSSSSSSPLSSVNNSNSDVILTGIYSLGSASSSRPTVKPLPSDSELPAHVHQTLLNQSQHRRNSSVSSPLQLHSRLGTLSLPRYKPPSLSSSPSLSLPPCPPIHSLSKRVSFPTSRARAGVGVGVPRSWARQYGSLQSGPWPSPSQPQARPHSNHQTLPPHPPRPRPSPPPHPIPPPSDHSPRIHQVFSLSERGEGEGIGQGQPSDRSRLEKHRQTPHPSDAIGCLSIAMETGDEEDEWRREEELSNMAATAHTDLQRGQGVRDSPSRGEGSGERGLTSPSLVLSSSRPGPYPRDSYPVTTTLQTSPSIQVPVSPSAPWLISNSRKRTVSLHLAVCRRLEPSDHLFCSIIFHVSIMYSVCVCVCVATGQDPVQ